VAMLVFGAVLFFRYIMILINLRRAIGYKIG
jgi:hypothetical protein